MGSERLLRNRHTLGDKMRVSRRAFTRWRALRCCVKVCYPVDMCFLLSPETDILSVRSVSNKPACLLIHIILIFSWHWTGFWVKGIDSVKLGTYQLCFAPHSSQAISGSRVANAVFATTAPTVMLQGNTSRGQFRHKLNLSEQCCFVCGVFCIICWFVIKLQEKQQDCGAQPHNYTMYPSKRLKKLEGCCFLAFSL